LQSAQVCQLVQELGHHCQQPCVWTGSELLQVACPSSPAHHHQHYLLVQEQLVLV
jgi:hypothetical protein